MTLQDKTDNWWDSTLDFSALSDIGMRRTNNQDSHREVPAASRRLWRERGHLFIVADGMGAHAAGELASQIATETIASSYMKRTVESPYDAIKGAVLEAHRQIRQRGDQEEAFRDMGTTADALVLLPEGAVCAHVGDSRTYRLRDGVYEQLTFDHSLLWELTKSGKVDQENIPTFIPKNVITRSLGPTVNPTVDLEGPFPLKSGDVFLLCSDGLSGQIADSEMGQILALLPPKEATRSLVNLTNLRGGPDNVTLVVVKVLGLPNPNEEDRFAGGNIKSPSFSFFGLFHSLVSPKKKEEPRNHVPFGKGPYVRTSVSPDPNFARKLFDVYRQLFQAIQARKPMADRSENIRLAEASRKAFGEKNIGAAIRFTLQNINLLMETLRQKDDADLGERE